MYHNDKQRRQLGNVARVDQWGDYQESAHDFEESESFTKKCDDIQ